MLDCALSSCRRRLGTVSMSYYSRSSLTNLMAFCGEIPEMVAIEGAEGDIYLGF